jgi:hypothetical protein
MADNEDREESEEFTSLRKPKEKKVAKQVVIVDANDEYALFTSHLIHLKLEKIPRKKLKPQLQKSLKSLEEYILAFIHSNHDSETNRARTF